MRGAILAELHLSNWKCLKFLLAVIGACAPRSIATKLLILLRLVIHDERVMVKNPKYFKTKI